MYSRVLIFLLQVASPETLEEIRLLASASVDAEMKFMKTAAAAEMNEHEQLPLPALPATLEFAYEEDLLI